MSQTTRILMIYQRLMTGRVVNKAQLALEFGTTERSIDRDILAIRLFLSDSFSGLELVYDRKENGYQLKNLRVKQEIGLGECYLLSKLLLNSQAVRSDEQQRTVENLLSQLSNAHRNRAMQTLYRAPMIPASENRTSLQLVEDLLYSIEQQDRILLHFGENYVNVCCVPYCVEFYASEAYLIALEVEEGLPALYSLGSIEFYRPGRQPYILSHKEIAALQKLVKDAYAKTEKELNSLVYHPKRKVSVNFEEFSE